MTWTTTLPTQPGVYWYRNQGSDEQICELREPTPGDFWVYPTSGSAFRIKGLDGFEWYGPIAPEEPQELLNRIIEDLEERIRESEE